MSALVTYVVTALGSVLAVVVLVIVVLLLNPEKVEKWSAMIWRLLAYWGAVFKGAHRHYVKLDLQGRINEFAKGLAGEAPCLATTRVQIAWTDKDVTRRSFLEQGKVILRLRRDDPEERNFVHGAYMFVSASLLAKAKRYVSPSQRKSLDLYVTTVLLEKGKPSVLGIFLDEYLHPETADAQSKVSRYVDAFAKIDGAGLFKSVVLQELDYLGDKVFGKRQDDKIVVEVNSLVEFLEPIASRSIGQDVDLRFQGDYCRFAVMIVGKPAKVLSAGHAPYVEFVRSTLIPKRIETLYVVGLSENRDILDLICQSLDDTYERVRARCSRVALRYKDQPVEADQYLVILRARGVRVIQASA